jgi:hypothetical protein
MLGEFCYLVDGNIGLRVDENASEGLDAPDSIPWPGLREAEGLSG